MYMKEREFLKLQLDNNECLVDSRGIFIHSNEVVRLLKLFKSKVKNEETLVNENDYCHCPTPALYTRIGETVSRCWSCHKIRQ